MRHRVYGKHLGRNKDERDNLFKGLIAALLTHGTIQTSETKAKAIKGLVDKVINLAKEKNTNRLSEYVSDKSLRDRLVSEVAPKLNKRTSGYTSLVKMGTRLGDQTMEVKMSIIGAEELKPIKKESRVKSQESSEEIKPKKKEVRHSELVAESQKEIPKHLPAMTVSRHRQAGVRHDGKKGKKS